LIEDEAELYQISNDLIEDIFRFKKEKCKNLSLIETMIEYSFKNDIPLQELGNIIADHKDYMEILRQELIDEGYFRGEEIPFDGMMFSDEEW